MFLQLCIIFYLCGAASPLLGIVMEYTTDDNTIRGVKFNAEQNSMNGNRMIGRFGHKALEIRQINITCSSHLPTQWEFECPEAITPTAISRITKQFSPSPNGGHQYVSSLILEPKLDERTNHVFDTNEQLSNVSCRQSGNENENITIVFRDTRLDENYSVQKWTNGAFNKSSNCPSPVGIDESCPLRITLDTVSSSFSCLCLSHLNSSSTSSKVISCYQKMDFCNSLSKSKDNGTSVTITTDNRKENTSIPFGVDPKILVCHGARQEILHFLLFGIIKSNGVSPKTTLLRTAEDVLKKTSESIRLRTVDRTAKKANDTTFYEGEAVTWQCSVLSSIFSQWPRIHFYGNPNESLFKTLNNVSHLSNATSGELSIMGKIIITKELKRVECTATLMNSIRTKSKNISLQILATERARIFNASHFCNHTGTFLVCRASGVPVPEIVWLNLKEVPATQSSLQQGIIRDSETTIKMFRESTLVLPDSATCNNLSSWGTVICKANGIGECDQCQHSFGFVTDKQSSKVWPIMAIVFGLFGSVMGFGLAIYFRKKSKTHDLFTDEEYDDFYNGMKSYDSTPDPLLLAYDIRFEIQRSEILMEGITLGSGEFGVVIQGKYLGTTVAIKTLKHTREKSYFKALLMELKTLQFIGYHPHIVNLVGACTENLKKMEVLLVLEYCENGNLMRYLRMCRTSFVDLYNRTPSKDSEPPFYQNNCIRNLNTRDLVRMATQVADAMSYVATKQILHGDLAARNILLTHDKQAKLSDFGLAKKLYHYNVYVQKKECPLPLRWMAIESLQDMEFSIESDVWSFGVTLWEMFALAEVPYPGMDWSFNSWRMLKDGYRLEIPQYANESLYRIMRECWNINPRERPTFLQLTLCLRQQLDKLGDD